MLVAQAFVERMPVLTADRRFSAYGVEVLDL
jgi:PIN domain nuclease of toxin-antitoxin system